MIYEEMKNKNEDLFQLILDISELEEIDFKILNYLGSERSLILKNIIDELDKPKSTVSYRIKLLEKNGFLMKIPTVSKEKPIKLTDKGIRIYFDRIIRYKNTEYCRKALNMIHGEIKLNFNEEIEWDYLYKFKKDIYRNSLSTSYSIFNEIFTDKNQLEKFLTSFKWLTHNKKSNVRWVATYALGYAFIYSSNKEQLWNELRKLIYDKDRNVQWIAIYTLNNIYSYVPDKNDAWVNLKDLIRNDDKNIRRIAIYTLGVAFAYINKKEQRWKNLLKLTNDLNSDVRRGAAEALGSAFQYQTNKEQAWKDLLALTKDAHRDVRWGAAEALGSTFQYQTDKEQASKVLLTLAKDPNSGVRWGAAEALGSTFQYQTDKEQASKVLLTLTKDENSDVRRRAAEALGSTFQYQTDKEQASKVLLTLTKDENSDVRRRAAGAFGSAFQYLIDKEQAYKDLLALTKDENSDVRWGAAGALGSTFQYLTNKEQAFKDLLALSKDEDRYVRVSANHSLGKISVYRATNAEDENILQKELENAIGFFEKSAQESTCFNPAEFCLPFYRLYYSVVYKMQEAEEEVKKNLDVAKRAVFGSENREKLLEAVENLSNALNEAQKLRELDDIKADLNGYRRYCDRASELLDSTEDTAPGATKLIRKGLPVIDERVQRIIEDIQEKSKALCKKTRNVESPLEPLGIEINQYAGELSTKDYLKSERIVPRITQVLGTYCKHLQEDKRGYACKLIEEINDEVELSDKLNKIELVLTYLEPQIEIEIKSPTQQFNAKQLEPTIGIITALPKEFTAMRILLENTTPFKIPGQGAGRLYQMGNIPSNNGEYHSIVLALADMGNNIAALRASLLLEHFPNVTSIIMIGIAGGVPHPDKPDEHVRLGDIVVSDYRGIVQYDFIFNKIEEKVYRFPPRPPSIILLEAVRLLEASEIEGNRPWLKYIDLGIDKLNFHRPSEVKDILVSSENPNEVILHPHDKKRIYEQPRVFYGPIASANKLLKNPIKRDELRDKFNIKAVEMESSGISDVTWNREIGYLVIRGICDYCDSNKGDDWQGYAAIVAAAYTRALIESM